MVKNIKAFIKSPTHICVCSINATQPLVCICIYDAGVNQAISINVICFSMDTRSNTQSRFIHLVLRDPFPTCTHFLPNWTGDIHFHWRKWDKPLTEWRTSLAACVAWQGYVLRSRWDSDSPKLWQDAAECHGVNIDTRKRAAVQLCRIQFVHIITSYCGHFSSDAIRTIL